MALALICGVERFIIVHLLTAKLISQNQILTYPTMCVIASKPSFTIFSLIYQRIIKGVLDIQSYPILFFSDLSDREVIS